MFDRLGESMADWPEMETLNLAVPLWIDKLAGIPDSQRIARASRCATVVGSQGDALQYKSTTPAGRRATMQAFNALAEGLACLAYMPGGVTFAGRHWCTGHAACQAAPGTQQTPPVSAGGKQEETS